jgi:dTDP-4-amino-4,6-dideoxygalactose transaminase
MHVPFLDLPAQYAPIRSEIDAAISEVMETGAFALGPTVADFESEFADYVGASHCVGVNSGTSALHLALLAGGVGPGDEVITTPHTWISTSWGISYSGAKPVYVDVDPHTGNLDPEHVEAAVTSRTRAILPVDLYGNPADHDALSKVAERADLLLIDDAAQAHGASLNGKPVGAFGFATCWSFYPGKNLGAAGEGGAIVTDDSNVAERLRSLRDHAQVGRHNHVEIGFNARMDGIQGAVLRVKLKYLDGWNERRRAAARRYGDLLSEIEGVMVPSVTAGATPSWHLYVIRVDDRESLSRALSNAGVSSGVHYPTPVHLQPAYAHLGYGPGDFPHAETFAATCLSLPMFPEITPAQQEHVAEAIADALKEVA